MKNIKDPKNWFVKLFTLGNTFSFQDFSDNFKKYFLELTGLFLAITFTFYVESKGEDFQMKKTYIKLVEVIIKDLKEIKDYTIKYSDEIDRIALHYKKQIEKWDIKNDSVFIDFDRDDSVPGGKYFYAPLAIFSKDEHFMPPSLSFEIFKSGNQDFRMVNMDVTLKIEELMEGEDLIALKQNTNLRDVEFIKSFQELVYKKWVLDLSPFNIKDNEFWIKNRRYIQKDKQMKYLLANRQEFWENEVKGHVESYLKIVENDINYFSEVVHEFNKERYFMYWKIN